MIVFIRLEARSGWCVEAPQTEHRGPDAVPGQKARWRQRKWRRRLAIVRRNGGASPPSSTSIHPPTGLILPHHEPTSLLQRTTGKLPDSPEARNGGFQNKTAGSWALMQGGGLIQRFHLLQTRSRNKGRVEAGY